MDVALVTCCRLTEPDPDAVPLGDALDAAGLSFRMVPWDDPEASVDDAALTVLRSCWNYPQHPTRFAAWIDDAATRTTLLNPAPLVRWNLHKSYLLDLQEAGVPVTPTVLVRRGAAPTLASVLGECGWTDVVVKPAISAGSYRTLRVREAEIADGERHLAALAEVGDTLIQPYLSSVEGHGERALVWIDGELTHAVRKTPRFQGEDELVSQESMPISCAEAAVAHAAIAAVTHLGQPLYGRVDVAPGPDGDPVVMELELLEPSLFFAQCEEALERYVEGIRRRL